MVLLDTVTGKYFKCQLLFSLHFECIIAHSISSIILNQSLSSVDHSSLKSRKGYDLLRSIFFSGSHYTNRLHGNSASSSESLYYSWEVPVDVSSHFCSHVADAIFFARFSASASPHMPTKPHDGPLTVGCTAAQRRYPCHVRVSWSPDPCWCSSCAMTGCALQRSVICYPWNGEIYLFLTLVRYTSRKEKGLTGMRIKHLLIFVLCVDCF